MLPNPMFRVPPWDHFERFLIHIASEEYPGLSLFATLEYTLYPYGPMPLMVATFRWEVVQKIMVQTLGDNKSWYKPLDGPKILL